MQGTVKVRRKQDNKVLMQWADMSKSKLGDHYSASLADKLRVAIALAVFPFASRL